MKHLICYHPIAHFFHLVDKSTDYQNYYQGLWDCAGDHPDELSFKRGDSVYILSKVWFEKFCLSEVEHWFVLSDARESQDQLKPNCNARDEICIQSGSAGPRPPKVSYFKALRGTDCVHILYWHHLAHRLVVDGWW